MLYSTKPHHEASISYIKQHQPAANLTEAMETLDDIWLRWRRWRKEFEEEMEPGSVAKRRRTSCMQEPKEREGPKSDLQSLLVEMDDLWLQIRNKISKQTLEPAASNHGDEDSCLEHALFLPIHSICLLRKAQHGSNRSISFNIIPSSLGCVRLPPQ